MSIKIRWQACIKPRLSTSLPHNLRTLKRFPGIISPRAQVPFSLGTPKVLNPQIKDKWQIKSHMTQY